MFIISVDVSRMVTHLTDFLEMGRHVTGVWDGPSQRLGMSSSVLNGLLKIGITIYGYYDWPGHDMAKWSCI